MKVYFVSGMGADSRVFKHIRLPKGYEIVHLDWIPPLKNESLASYSGRLSGKIVPGEKFALLGLSMGGMIACEIAKQAKFHDRSDPVITILLSSVTTNKHFPVHFKISRLLKMYKWVPVHFLKSASILNRFFSTDNKEDKDILNLVIKESDPAFIRWALQAVLQWKNEIKPQPLLHIHGSKDKVLPLRFAKPTHIIKDGSHLMVMSRAAELNRLIGEALLSAQN